MRRCSFCYGMGHNRTTCPAVKEMIVKDPTCFLARQANALKESRDKGVKNRRCGYCTGAGHNKKTCDELKTDRTKKALEVAAWRARFLNHCQSRGLGVGTLLKFIDPLKLSNDWHGRSVKNLILSYGEYMVVTDIQASKLNGGTMLNYGDAPVVTRTMNGMTRFYGLPSGFEDFCGKYSVIQTEIVGKVDCNFATYLNYDWHSGIDVAEELLTFPKYSKY